MRLSALLLMSVFAVSVFAQDTTTTGTSPTGAPIPNRIGSLVSTFFEHDYFSYNVYANGVYDSYAPIVQNGQTVNNGGTGFAVGGGINAYHAFRDGGISLDYRGDYRDYQTSVFSSGTDQNLSFAFSKRLSRRWTFGTWVSAGIFFYGGTFFPVQESATSNTNTTANTVVTNPFSPETRYLTSGVSMSYRQTRRLSYVFAGYFYRQGYNYPGAIGTTGGSGSVSVHYRLAPRTDLSGYYTHSYFVYTGNAGNSSVDSLGATVSHSFPSHWYVSGSGGWSRVDASGFVAVPVTLIVPGSTEAVGGYVLGHYSRLSHVPAFSGTVAHTYRHSVLSASAGQGVTGAGNGYFLASRSVFVNGYYSYNIERTSSFGVGGGYYRLSSVANTVSNAYSTVSITASYGRTLIRRFGTYLRYEFIHNGALEPASGVTDNRISFGFNYSSKSVPMTLF